MGRESHRERPGTEHAGERLPLRSFVLARLGFPRAELRQLVVREACRRIMSRWLNGIPRQAEMEAMPAAERVEEPAAGAKSIA